MYTGPKNFEEVTILTNALNNNILLCSPRKTDSIIYNLNCIPQNFNTEKFMLNQPGFRSLSLVISRNINIELLKVKLKQIFKDEYTKQRLNVTIDFDRSENLFDNYNIYISYINNISLFCILNDIKIVVPNHNCILPPCINDRLISLYKQIHTYPVCTGKQPHFIDSSYNFKFCAFYPKKVLNLFENDREIEWNQLINKNKQICQERYKKLKKQRKMCVNCNKLSVSCSGGCFTIYDK